MKEDLYDDRFKTEKEAKKQISKPSFSNTSFIGPGLWQAY